MFKVIAVVVNVSSPSCGTDIGIGCHLIYEDGDISRATFDNIFDCRLYASRIYKMHLERGEHYNTFCAEFHD